MRRQQGIALLVVLVILLAVGASSTAFIWFMQQQQMRAGLRYRSAAALAVAEGGVHRALAVIEGTAPEGGAGRTWRPTGYTEALSVGPLPGRFTLTLNDAADGSVTVTSVGEVAGVSRRLRARVVLASPALLAGLFGQSIIRLENQGSATFILPYGAAAENRPWVHMAAGRGIWFATPGVAVNDGLPPSDLAPGPSDPPRIDGSAAVLPRPGPLRILLAADAALMVGPDYRQTDIGQARSMGVAVDGVIRRVASFPAAPSVDRAIYRALASANTVNAALNQAAGEAAANETLARKRDSLYRQEEFQQVLTYLHGGLVPPRLQGVIYVIGGVSLLDAQRLQITDGALIAEHTVELHPGARLEVAHAAATRTLPGLVVLGDGGLFINSEARLQVHGLVHISRLIDVHRGARVDVVGAIVGADPHVSLRSDAAQVVIRYDPATLGTTGLSVPDGSPLVAWVAAWEEVP